MAGHVVGNSTYDWIQLATVVLRVNVSLRSRLTWCYHIYRRLTESLDSVPRQLSFDSVGSRYTASTIQHDAQMPVKCVCNILLWRCGPCRS